MEERAYWVYMLASGRNGTLYVGVTSRLAARVWEHREARVDGFARRYRVRALVWYEQHRTAEAAITREKQIKKWRRAWKVALIERANPYWNDLFSMVCQ